LRHAKARISILNFQQVSSRPTPNLFGL
jgi:hypothetical protein